MWRDGRSKQKWANDNQYQQKPKRTYGGAMRAGSISMAEGKSGRVAGKNQRIVKQSGVAS